MNQDNRSYSQKEDVYKRQHHAFGYIGTYQLLGVKCLTGLNGKIARSGGDVYKRQLINSNFNNLLVSNSHTQSLINNNLLKYGDLHC